MVNVFLNIKCVTDTATVMMAVMNGDVAPEINLHIEKTGGLWKLVVYGGNEETGDLLVST